ncbi:hypothetical protein PFISCL1PPCAC_5421, partial [Pristionchus fissidentatus]
SNLWNTVDEPEEDTPHRYRTNQPYTLCPVGSLIDWRPERVASLVHITVGEKTNQSRYKKDSGKKEMNEKSKAYDEPFVTVEHGRTCVMTLGFTERESRPILAYVGTEVPQLLETSKIGWYRLTRHPRRDPLTGQIVDMAVFYAKEKHKFDNCELYSGAQHIQLRSPTGFYFIVCRGSLEKLIDKNTKSNIAKAGDKIKEQYLNGNKPHKRGQKWNYLPQNNFFLDPKNVQRRFGRVMNESYHGWAESVMPHYDLRTVIYEVRYKKTRTESDAKISSRFVLATWINILLCIFMEKFYVLLRKYLL